jgi:acetyl esterase
VADHAAPNPIVNALSNAIGAMRADADMHELAKAHEELGPRAIEKLTVEEARREPTVADAVKHLLSKQAQPGLAPQADGITRRDIAIPTPAGELHAFAYQPQDTDVSVIVYFHGGGWVIADAQTYEGGARGLARGANALVISPDYRQAPEHKFPAAWDDALAVYRWVLENARSLGADPMRIALAGESAGGTLAMATAIAARDAGLPLPRHIVAVYPVAQTGSRHTESYLENAIAKPLNKAMMDWFFGHVIRNEGDLADPRLDLVHAALAGLPPVTIINATLDPLRSDGALLETALRNANVPVEREVYTGVAHEFFGCAAVLEKAREAQGYAAQRLRNFLG